MVDKMVVTPELLDEVEGWGSAGPRIPALIRLCREALVVRDEMRKFCGADASQWVKRLSAAAGEEWDD